MQAEFVGGAPRGRILRCGARRPLLDLAGWYSHPDPDSLPHWAENHAVGAQVYWNDDGSLVALDERSHNYEGTVLVARRRRDGRFLEVTLPEKAILAATGCRWERQRLGRPEWEARRQLNLELVGRLEGGGGAYHTFEVVLHLSPAGAVRIESVRERPE